VDRRSGVTAAHLEQTSMPRRLALSWAAMPARAAGNASARPNGWRRPGIRLDVGCRQPRSRAGERRSAVRTVSRPNGQGRLGTRRIELTSIYVDDQDQAQRFYTETLGFKVKTSAPYSDTERWLSMVPPHRPRGGGAGAAPDRRAGAGVPAGQAPARPAGAVAAPRRLPAAPGEAGESRMRRIRIHQPTSRERRWRQVLPVAPSDSEIVRARRLHASADPRRTAGR
jgi:catechol 2,3-dioxygenase-like lactoylglutathione lyase family enzyme